ncbi:MAG: hypothetical protein A3K19_13080 [Lentisphaerae bacterium RIFOXYB12_FULL_65_16]|nr:MAG: hypothetical protein A3K18_04625 [Lentisphaerae bacterium RIFOXYA12_64_32]OGV87243.1 MAG: hypothetical protein A3K19_13080 [Lentisphaerae bacterium RIFOXYB12_FULL_65_16]
MPQLDKHALYELDILEHVEKDSRLNNRLVAQKLGVSIKLAHEILKRMVHKGLLHVKVVHSRRWDYFLTPTGLTAKARLTLEFLDFSMHFYREARRRSSQVCRDLAESGVQEVAFLGSGDLAEIAYLGIQQWGLRLAAVYDEHADGKRRFMNIVVRPLAAVSEAAGGAIIICAYDATMPMRKGYLPEGLERSPGMRWVFE